MLAEDFLEKIIMTTTTTTKTVYFPLDFDLPTH